MSEFDWIARYFAPLVKTERAAGLLDDVAELSGHGKIITTDALVEGVHFLSADPIDTVARKLVRVNVSDIIAKGARPDEAVLTLGWPADRSEQELATFAAALGDELAAWGASLIGGDTVSTPVGVFVSLTLTGTLGDGERPIRRSGANVGDDIWVTGQIGLGGQGLSDARNSLDTVASRHYRVPNLPSLAVTACLQNHASASMDVSDGLVGDLQKLCGASGVGARLQLDAVPIYVGDAAPVDVDTCLVVATAGDDYQCLFTASRQYRGRIMDKNLEISRIGQVSDGNSVQLRWHETNIATPKMSGFQHQS